MNRIIKFRGKSVETGEWVYGDLIHRTGIPSTVSPVQIDDTGVDPETVGQFTGLTDKNGKEIYEGDIVDLSGCWWDAAGPAGYSKPIQAVEFDDGIAGFTPFSNYDCDCGVYYSACDSVVLGNIHDNPELISNTEKNNQ